MSFFYRYTQLQQYWYIYHLFEYLYANIYIFKKITAAFKKKDTNIIIFEFVEIFIFVNSRLIA